MFKKSILAITAFVLLGSISSHAAKDAKWKQIKSKKGIQVFKMDIEGSPLVAFRGTGVVKTSVEKLLTILSDNARKKDWVARLGEARVLEVISPTKRIEYNHTLTPFILKDRDFVFEIETKLLPGEKSLVSTIKSVEHSSMPTSNDKVRGQLINSMYKLTPNADNTETKVEVEIHADPKGKVPKWIVNIFQRSWPLKTIQGIQEQAAREDILVDPKFNGAHKAIRTGDVAALKGL